MNLDPATRDAVRDGCRASARALAPLMVREWGRGKCPGRIIDLGAGEGWFTRELQIACPLSDTLALDIAGGGPDPHSGIVVDRWDAEARDIIPTCDMAVCLEVAEHLSVEAGVWLVGAICASATWGCWWSAAIPGQGGDGHVNEAWPAYWNALFNDHDWQLTDPVRDLLWDHPQVEPWYAQNLLLATPRTDQHRDLRTRSPRALIHPVTYAYHRGVAYP